MEIKNLFNYATKELSQDAFLRWLFENYKCDVEGVRKVCYKVLQTFLGFEINEGDILNLKTYAQDYKIDVMVVLTIKTARKEKLHIIAIEDKAFSGEHDQLDNYNEALKKLAASRQYHGQKLDSFNLRQIHKVFYKTDLKDSTELNKVKKDGWKPYYIDDIYKDIFAEFTSNGNAIPTGSEVLDHYIDRICYLYKNLSFVSDSKVVEWDRTNFRSFLINRIKPYAKSVANEKNVLLEAKEWSWQGRYISLGLVHHFQITKNRFPYLEFSMEITARDFDIPENGMFSISLRCARLEREMNDNTKKNVELLQEDADPARAGLKQIIKESPSSGNFRLFKLINYKACIATASDELSEKLSYSQNLIVIEAYIKEAIDRFVDICTNSFDDIKKQNLPEYDEPDYNYIIIKVNKWNVEEDTKEKRNAKNSRYDVTRRCWVIAEHRRNTDNYKYVLSVSNGIVYEVYEIKEWKKAEGTDNRYEFEGAVAPWKIREHFLGKLVPEKYRGLRWPLLYYDAQSKKEGYDGQN